LSAVVFPSKLPFRLFADRKTGKIGKNPDSKPKIQNKTLRHTIDTQACILVYVFKYSCVYTYVYMERRN